MFLNFMFRHVFQSRVSVAKHKTIVHFDESQRQTGRGWAL